MTKAKPPKEPTSFGPSSADGGHAAAQPGLASAHKPKSTNGRIPKAKKASTTPTAGQLRRSAVRAEKAVVPELADKYQQVAVIAPKRPKMSDAE